MKKTYLFYDEYDVVSKRWFDKMNNIEKKKSELCMSCLECCKWMIFTVPYSVNTLKAFYANQYYLARGCRVVDVGHSRYVQVLVPSICPQLNEDFGCMIYENRPEACRLYDGRKDPFLKNICKWSELEEG